MPKSKSSYMCVACGHITVRNLPWHLNTKIHKINHAEQDINIQFDLLERQMPSMKFSIEIIRAETLENFRWLKYVTYHK